MQDNYNIKDVLLSNNEDPKTTNVKKVLMAIAALVVLFLIILIIMKFINSGNIDTDEPLVLPEQTQNELNKIDENLKNLKEEIKPIDIGKEPKVVETKNKEEPKKTEIIEINPPQKYEETTTIAKKEEPKETEAKEVKKVVVSQDIKSKEEIKPKEEPKKEVKKETKNTETPKKPEPKKVAKEQKQPEKKITKVEKKPDLKATRPVNIDPKSKTYIQVLATKEFEPNETYIKKLKEKGYSYTLYKTDVKGVKYTKVLVGPFNERDLQNELNKIRANINKDAFVFRKK